MFRSFLIAVALAVGCAGAWADSPVFSGYSGQTFGIALATDMSVIGSSHHELRMGRDAGVTLDGADIVDLPAEVLIAKLYQMRADALCYSVDTATCALGDPGLHRDEEAR